MLEQMVLGINQNGEPPEDLVPDRSISLANHLGVSHKYLLLIRASLCVDLRCVLMLIWIDFQSTYVY